MYLLFFCDADNRKGWNFTLMKMFWRRSSKINILLAQLSKMSRKRSYFLQEATDWDNIAKGQPSSFGLSAFIISLKTALVYYKSVSFLSDVSDTSSHCDLTEHRTSSTVSSSNSLRGVLFYFSLPLRPPTVPQKSSI